MAKPAPQPAALPSVADQLGAGREVHSPPTYENVAYATGFGVARRPEIGGHGIARIEREPVARAIHFWWPGPLKPDDGIVIGELTDEARAAVEAKAVADLLAVAGDAPMLFWRCLPKWEEENYFDRQETHHRFFLRGSFVWNEAA